MILPPDAMIDILRNGGGLIVSTKGLMPDTMVAMARNAAAGHARLTFRVEGVLLPETMKDVGRNGGGVRNV